MTRIGCRRLSHDVNERAHRQIEIDRVQPKGRLILRETLDESRGRFAEAILVTGCHFEDGERAFRASAGEKVRQFEEVGPELGLHVRCGRQNGVEMRRAVERRRVDAGIAHPRRFRGAKARVRRDGAIRGKAGIGDDAAGLASLRAEGDVLERPADLLAIGDVDVRPWQDGQDEFRLGWLAVDLGRQELGQQPRTLAVADENDAPAAVVLGEIGAPSRQHIGVRHSEGHVRVATEQRGKAGERYLTIKRREGPAHGRKRRELLARGRILVRRGGNRAERRADPGDGGIDVKTVDGSVRLRREGHDGLSPTRFEYRGSRRRGAGIAAARTAQPRSFSFVVRRGRHVGRHVPMPPEAGDPDEHEDNSGAPQTKRRVAHQ